LEGAVQVKATAETTDRRHLINFQIGLQEQSAGFAGAQSGNLFLHAAPDMCLEQCLQPPPRDGGRRRHV
jgi:hypothetical protein